MAFRLNPFTGNFDACGSSTPRWAFNPFTGKLDRDYDRGGFVFNPFTGTLDAIIETPSAPTSGLTWGVGYAIEWSVGNYLAWGN